VIGLQREAKILCDDQRSPRRPGVVARIGEAGGRFEQDLELEQDIVLVSSLRSFSQVSRRTRCSRWIARVPLRTRYRDLLRARSGVGFALGNAVTTETSRNREFCGQGVKLNG